MRVIGGGGDESTYREGFLAIGNFDGVHRGHQEMIRVLREEAARAAAPSVVMTFDPPPAALLRPDSVPPSLSSLARKAELLRHYGVDAVIAWPTDQALLQLTAREFFDEIVIKTFAARGMVEGPNFFFGRNRGGNVAVLAEFCSAAGLTLRVVDPVVDGPALVSSSRIRTLVAAGDMTEAVAMLGHPYRLTGHVGRGAGRGAGLGFPTANLEGISTLIPAPGVYAGVCQIDSQQWRVALNVGPNPTFQDNRLKVEAHVVDYHGDLYDRELNLDVLSRIRGVRQFGSAEELVEQIRRDVATARRVEMPGAPNQ